MPLSLKIERYQRSKMLNGLDPSSMANQKDEVSKILMSLKYIQKFEDDVDEATKMLRERGYEAFMADPTGANLVYMQEREKKLKELNVFAQRIAFIEDTNLKHSKNQPVSIGKKQYQQELQRAEKNKLESEEIEQAEQLKQDVSSFAAIDDGDQEQSEDAEDEVIQSAEYHTRKDMSQYQLDHQYDPPHLSTEASLVGRLGITTTYQRKEKQKAAEFLGVPNAELLNGVVNNDVMIPKMYFERTVEQRLQEKNSLLDKLSKLMAVEQANN